MSFGCWSLLAGDVWLWQPQLTNTALFLHLITVCSIIQDWNCLFWGQEETISKNSTLIFFPSSKFKVPHTQEKEWERQDATEHEATISINNHTEDQSCLAVRPGQMSLFTVLSNVWKGLSNNKHTRSPVLSLARKSFGKIMTPWKWQPCGMTKLSKVSQPLLVRPLCPALLPAPRKTPGQLCAAGESSKVSLLNCLTSSTPHPFFVPSKILS